MKISSRGGGVDDISFKQLITRENLLRAWQKFSRGKWRQRAVCRFWLDLEDELVQLYHDLARSAYQHGPYYHFVVHDTKRRDIYVAQARDRVVHQLLSSYLEERFGPHFIAQSFAAQKGKGVHAARAYVLGIMRQLQRCGARVWVGKLDVEKYFANIDHKILMQLLSRRIPDAHLLDLCRKVIVSFETGSTGRGLPLGNLTSQWFANIYLHELDLYAKHTLRIQHYMRYNDDIILVGSDEKILCRWMEVIRVFVAERLRLTIPARKTVRVCLPAEVDVLGWHTNGRRVRVRPTTVQKATARLNEQTWNLHPVLLDSLCSYAGSGIATFHTTEDI